MKKSILLLAIILTSFTVKAQDKNDLNDSIRYVQTRIDNIQLNLNKYYHARSTAICTYFTSAMLAFAATRVNEEKVQKEFIISSVITGVLGTVYLFYAETYMKKASIKVYPTKLKITF